MPYKGTIGPGKVVLYSAYKPGWNSKEWFSKAQQIFTRMKWTHTALGFFKYENHFNDVLFESIELQCTTLWNPNVKSEYEIYQIKWYTQQEIEKALWKTFVEFNGTSYGFLQVLYFVRRYIWETPWIKKYFGWIPFDVFGKPRDVRQWNNWFVGGTICSELFYTLMANLNQIRFHDGVNRALSTWNKNNFHSGDSRVFILSLPEIFEFEYHKPGGIE